MTTERSREEAPETEAAVEAGKKSLMGKLKLPLIIVAVLVVLGVAAMVVLPKLTSSKEKPAEATKEAASSEKSGEASVEKQGPSALFPLDPFIINLRDPAGKRYLKIRIELELSNKELEAQIKERMPQIKDGLLILLSSKSYEDIEPVEGKLRLRQEIVSRINGLLSSGRVQNIYFTEFVVQ
jgi:flagellar FliL protein